MEEWRVFEGVGYPIAFAEMHRVVCQRQLSLVSNYSSTVISTKLTQSVEI